MLPATLCVDDTLLYNTLTVPYSNHALVDNPLALTVPFNVAEVVVTFVAAPVVTSGGFSLTCTGVLLSMEEPFPS